MVTLDNYSPKNDAELVRLALQNQDNFLYLIKRYENKLLRYIQRISNISLEDAKDILQEVFIKVYYKLNDFDPDLKFSSWIYRITHNQVISHYRKLQARPKTVFLDTENNLIENIKVELKMESDIDLAYLQKNIFKILNQLPEKYKEVLVLKFFEEKSYQEISDILKIPMGTVATLINKGKKFFKENLAKQEINLKQYVR
ncbi:sigma-70 family RNA polymerase sigma factor [Patescibacteria group bacterium]|nr:sigma-70 family RNA polymerase sigma factor [Patescibacteria group bacterium]